MNNKIISNIQPLGFTWQTKNPFLFCVHHLDNYPPGNDQLGPNASLKGRNLGQDFTLKDGWRMYHGETIPGFPTHPHRGFETVTIVLQGFVDHSDSHGAAGRYGNGDVQWMTAGSGLQHSEMFPLLNKKENNPCELFQIWLNLPKANKFCKPYFKMLWKEEIPVIKELDENGKLIEVRIIAGRIGEVKAPAPAPNSWASDKNNGVAIWLIKLEANSKWNIPAASNEVYRSLYFYKGLSLKIAGVDISNYHSVELLSDQDVSIDNGKDDSFLLLLQGCPIDEPVIQYGPFVMNSKEEITQAFDDFNKTHFGGWPWPKYDNVHPISKGRFAKYSDGKEEIK